MLFFYLPYVLLDGILAGAGAQLRIWNEPVSAKPQAKEPTIILLK